MKLNTINLTSFEEKPDSPAYVAIGGKDALGKSAEVHSVSTPAFLKAAERLLKPSLDAVLKQSHANLAKLLAALDNAKAEATEAHVAFAREQRRLFAATTGQVANQQLETDSGASVNPNSSGNWAKATVITTA